jgi:transcriptional regulator with XRE-family HTH domain
MKAEWFAGRLRELREQAGLSRQQLADRAGMKLGGIRNLEQGMRKPSWETVLALCQALRVSCDAFTKQPGELPPPRAGRPRKLPASAEPLDSDVQPDAASDDGLGEQPAPRAGDATGQADAETAQKRARRIKGK